MRQEYILWSVVSMAILFGATFAYFSMIRWRRISPSLRVIFLLLHIVLHLHIFSDWMIQWQSSRVAPTAAYFYLCADGWRAILVDDKRFLFCYFSIIGFTSLADTRSRHKWDRLVRWCGKGGDGGDVSDEEDEYRPMNEKTFLLLHMIAIQVFFFYRQHNWINESCNISWRVRRFPPHAPSLYF